MTEVHFDLCLLVGNLRTADHLHDLYGSGVGGTLDRVGKQDLAEVGAVGVVRTGTEGAGFRVVDILFDRFVLDDRGEVELLVFDRDRIGEQRLDGRTGLQGGMRRSVPRKVGGLAVGAADGGNDSAVKIHQNGAELDAGIGALVHVHRCLLDVVLHFLVHRAVDLQTLGVYFFTRRAGTDVVVLGEVFLQIIEQLVVVPVLHVALVVLFLGGVLEADKGHVGALGHRLLIFLVGDNALVVHLAEDQLTAFLVVFGVDQRIPAGRVLGDAGDRRAFRQRTVLDALAEVELCRRLDSLAVIAEVDDVEICLQDLILGVFLLQLERLADLAQLTVDRHLVVVGDVLDELLGDGGTAVGVLAGGEHDDRRQGTRPVHAVVLIESLVLDGDLRLLHVLGNVLVVDPYTVFCRVELARFGELAGFLVLDEDPAGLVHGFRLEVDTRRLRRKRDDVDRQGNTRHHAGDEQYGKDRQQKLAEPLKKFFCAAFASFEGHFRLLRTFSGVAADVGFTFVAHSNSFEQY